MCDIQIPYKDLREYFESKGLTPKTNADVLKLTIHYAINKITAEKLLENFLSRKKI